MSSFNLGTTEIGRDAMRIVFQFLLKKMNDPKRKKPRKWIFRYWKLICLVSKDWNRLAWEEMDVTMLKNYPLRRAIQNGSLESVKKILSFPQCNPNENQLIMFKEACKLGYHEILKVLLDDPRVDPSTWVVSNTKMMDKEAAINGYLEILKTLYNDPRFVKSPDHALLWAICGARFEVVEYLMKITSERPNPSNHIYSGARRDPKGMIKIIRLMIDNNWNFFEGIMLFWFTNEVLEVLLESPYVTGEGLYQQIMRIGYADKHMEQLETMVKHEAFIEYMECNSSFFVNFNQIPIKDALLQIPSVRKRYEDYLKKSACLVSCKSLKGRKTNTKSFQNPANK